MHKNQPAYNHSICRYNEKTVKMYSEHRIHVTGGKNNYINCEII